MLGNCKGEEYHLQKGRVQEEDFAPGSSDIIAQRARGNTILSIVDINVKGYKKFMVYIGPGEGLWKHC